jgi:PilZ domain-containing protein
MEKRRFTRVDFVINALVKYDATAFRGEVENLSLHGIFIKTDQSMPVGTTADITICLAEMEPEILINLSARVVRVGDGGIGFKFDRIDLDSFTHLRSIISYRKGDADSVMTEFTDFLEQGSRDNPA